MAKQLLVINDVKKSYGKKEILKNFGLGLMKRSL